MATLPDRWPPGPGPRPPAGDAPRPVPLPGPPTPLWADGGFRLRVTEAPGASARELWIDRPFALVGRLAGADVRIEDRAVSGRHVYLHLDGRGLYAVDLATRTGTRFDDRERPAGWLAPGQALEVAGRCIELLECRVRDARSHAAAPPEDLLGDAGATPLARVTLYPGQPPGTPRALGSELVFLGRGGCCGVRVEEASASRIHCALIRTRDAAFVVDLIGRGTWLNGLPLRGAGPLRDGDALTVGAARFEVRVDPAGGTGRWAGPVPRRPSMAEVLPADVPRGPESFPLPVDAQGALLAWMMGQLQAQQGEALRRQSEFHDALTGLVRQMQEDQATLLSQHLERSEAIQREVAALRAELDRWLLAPAPAPAPAADPAARTPPPLRIMPAPLAADPEAATSWLIGRINQLEDENRSSWKDLLGRLTGTGPRRMP